MIILALDLASVTPPTGSTGGRPDVATLHRLLSYDPDTGALTWKARGVDMFRCTKGRSAEHACSLWNSKLAGKPAGSDAGQGYLKVRLPCGMVPAHRVIWAMMTGEWPPEVDHINRHRADNRWVNLRAVGRLENARNHGIQRNNTSGAPGLSRRDGKWRARIGTGGQRASLGNFTCFGRAVMARRRAEVDLGYYGGRQQ